MVRETEEHGFSSTLQAIQNPDWIRQPVSAKQFIEDDYYFGKLNLFPGVKKDFIEIIDSPIPCLELILTGSLRWGKSFLGGVLGGYHIHYLSCMRNPQSYLGIDPATSIYFINLSVTGYQASEGVFSDMMNMVDQSAYFKENFPRNLRVNSALVFPKNIVAKSGTSSEFSAIGKNVYWAMIDESNFFGVKKNSAKSLDASGDYDAARVLYEALIRRIRLTYTGHGISHGMGIISSSSRYPQDFIEKKIEFLEKQKANGEFDGTSRVIRHSVWDVKDPSVYVRPKFKVLVGSRTSRSRILDASEDASKIEGKIIEVPGEFKSFFQENIETAVRDLGGLSSQSISRFFKNVEALEKIFDTKRVHPYSEETSINFQGTLLWEKIVRRDMATGNFVPLLNPKAPRGIALDLSTTGDPTGFVMAHISGKKEVLIHDEECLRSVKVEMPVVTVDFILRVLPPPDYEIDQDSIQRFIFKLMLFGFNIAFVVADRVQSAAVLQAVRKKGVDSRVKSSREKSYKPYDIWKNSVYQNRFQCYPYPPLLDEMTSLEDSHGIIDHPVGGHNDLSDVCANVVDELHERFSLYGYPLAIVESSKPVHTEDSLEQILFQGQSVSEIQLPEEIESDMALHVHKSILQNIPVKWESFTKEEAYALIVLFYKKRDHLNSIGRGVQARTCETEIELGKEKLISMGSLGPVRSLIKEHDSQP